MIQVNQCAQEELEWLPGVGAKTARKIIAARPVKDTAQLEQLIPPSAWLKIQEAGAEFGFEEKADGDEHLTVEKLEAALTAALTPVEPPITLLQKPQALTLRRVMPGQALQRDSNYLCLWNVRWGPAGEAVRPQDAAIQVEIETKLRQHGVGVMFAHYAASVRVATDSYGQVPVLLFEIILEETGDDNEAKSDGGIDQGIG